MSSRYSIRYTGPGLPCPMRISSHMHTASMPVSPAVRIISSTRYKSSQLLSVDVGLASLVLALGLALGLALLGHVVLSVTTLSPERNFPSRRYSFRFAGQTS